MTFLCQNPLPKLPIGISSFARLRAGTLRRSAMNPDSPGVPSPAKLPVGVSEFRQLRDEGFWYADKTRFIEELENDGWPCNVFVRPKGFGKTVFLSMLEAYYDRYGARDFERLFADTYIARHKTPYQGAFRVLRLDFADVADPADGSRALCEAIRQGFTDFFRRYPIPHWKTLLEKECDFPGSLLHDLLSEVRYRSESPGIMLLIDNFDCLTRPLIDGNTALIQDWRTPHYLRSFFKPFEYFINNGLADFVYIMGETLLGLEYLISDGPDVQHLYKQAHFAAFAGLTEEDFRRLIDADALLAGVSPTEIFDEMQHFCGSYQFAEQRSYGSNTVSVYPTAEVLRFITAGRSPDQTTRDFQSYASDDLEKLVSLYAAENPQYVGEIIRSLGNGRAVPNNGGCRLGDRFFFRYSGLLTLLFGLGYLTLSLESENDLIGPTRDMERRFAQLADEIRNQYPDARC